MVTVVEITSAVDIPGFSIEQTYWDERGKELRGTLDHLGALRITPGDLFSHNGDVFMIRNIQGRAWEDRWEWTAEQTNVTPIRYDPVDIEVAVDGLLQVLKETDGEDPSSD